MEFDKELLEKTIPELEHFGVKGMRWGVRRKNSSGKSGSTKEPGRVKQEIASFKREVSTRKDLKNVSKLNNKQLKSKTERLRSENDLKRLSSRDEYLKRSKLSDKQIKTRVERLRLEDALKQQINSANKDNVALANKIITETAKFALTAYTGTVGVQVADTIIKESLKYASQNKVIKQSLKDGYEMRSNVDQILAVIDNPELEHFGVKGMKWGKRKADSYMNNVNKHEAKTKARRSMTYMEKVREHESKTKARRETPKSKQHKQMVAAAALGTTSVIAAALLSKHYNVTPESVAGSITKGKNMIKKHINTEVQKQLTTKVPDIDKFRKQFDVDLASVSSTYKKQNSTTKATTKPAVKKESSKKSSSKLDSLLDETSKLAKLLDKGELTPGQSARWRAANDEMIELFKENRNPYMK